MQSDSDQLKLQEHRVAKKSKNRAQLLQISQSMNAYKKKESQAPRIDNYSTIVPSQSYIICSDLNADLETNVDRNKTLVLEQLEIAKKSISNKKTSSMVEKFIERAIDRYKTSGDSKKSRQKFNSVQSSKQTNPSSSSKNYSHIVSQNSIHSQRILLPPRSIQVLPQTSQSVKQTQMKRKLEDSQVKLKTIQTTNEALQKLKQGTDSIVVQSKHTGPSHTSRKLSQRGSSLDKSARGDSRDKSARISRPSENQANVTLDSAKKNYGSVKSKPLERISLKQKSSRQKNNESGNGYNSIISSSSHQRASSQISAQENRSPANRSKMELTPNQKNDSQAHKVRVQLAKSKMNHYCKEISFTTIKEFLKYQTPPSKLCFRAARCICVLLNAFYHYSHFKDCSFTEWDQIRNFLQFRYAFIIQDIENIRGKCDGKQVQNDSLLDILKKEVLVHNEFADSSQLSSELVSPKIQNLIYKPIFCYAFFVMSYLNLIKASQADKIQHSRSNSPYTKHAPSESISSRQGNQSEKSGQSKKIVLSELSVNKQQNKATAKKREFGANIANQIFDTIKRVLEPSEFTRLIKKPQKQVLHSKSRAQSQLGEENHPSLRESEQSMKSMIDLRIEVPSTCMIQPHPKEMYSVADSLDFKRQEISASSSGVCLNQIYKTDTPQSILSQRNPNNDTCDQSDYDQHRGLEENTIDQELQSIDRRLAETLKQNIQNLQKRETVKVEDLLSSIKGGPLEPTSYFTNRKRSAIVQLSNQQMSTLTPLDTNELEQNYYTENQDVRIEDFYSKMDQQKILEAAFEDFSKEDSMIEDEEYSRSDIIQSQCSDRSHQIKRELFIKELKERREQSGVRLRGQDLEEQTLKTIRDLSHEMEQDTGRTKSKFDVKIVKVRSSHTSSRPTSRGGGDQSFTSLKKSEKEHRGLKLDKDRMKKTMNLLAMCDN